MNFLFLCLLGIFIPCITGNTSGKVKGFLDTTQIFIVWSTSYEKQLVFFTISAIGPHVDWIGIGFSDHGKFNNSDICIYQNGKLMDYFINDDFQLHIDRAQDCELLQSDFDETSEVIFEGERKIFKFQRRFTTCDPKDYAFEPGTTQMIIAGGNEFSTDFNKPSIRKSLHYGKLIDNMKTNIQLEEDAKRFRVLAENAKVPDVVTSYWCTVKKIPRVVQRKKHHIVKINSVVQSGNEHIVHHMVIYACQSNNQKEFSMNCNNPNKPESARTCSRVVGAWSMGEEDVSYPEEAGLPIGGPGGSDFLMVEIHYNNVEKSSGMEDSSGFEFYITPTLRPYDAGIIELGLIYSDANSIPPQQDAFPITAYCVEDCTQKLPKEGINIFASQLHAHLTGRKLWTSHYRNGVKLGELNRDNHYSPHWQHVQHIHPYTHVKRGDVLATTCVYETRDRSDITLGGYGIEDEMCVNYIYYFPLSDVEVCKSAVDNSTLHQYFSKKHKIKNQELSIMSKYHSVLWNKENAASLHELYSSAPLNIHCLQHDGSLFPKTNWTKIPLPTINSGPYLKTRDHYECPALNDF